MKEDGQCKCLERNSEDVFWDERTKHKPKNGTFHNYFSIVGLNAPVQPSEVSNGLVVPLPPFGQKTGWETAKI
jgi:hypothetical protein